MRFFRRLSAEPNFKYLYFISFFNVFLILLIFVMFLPKIIKPQGLVVFLPRAITSEPISEKGFVVSILKNNSIFLGNRKVTFGELSHFVRLQEGVKAHVLIKADQGADIGVLVEIWDLFRASGISEVNIATNG